VEKVFPVFAVIGDFRHRVSLLEGLVCPQKEEGKETYWEANPFRSAPDFGEIRCHGPERADLAQLLYDALPPAREAVPEDTEDDAPF
jgi:hypothetical protein